MVARMFRRAADVTMADSGSAERKPWIGGLLLMLSSSGGGLRLIPPSGAGANLVATGSVELEELVVVDEDAFGDVTVGTPPLGSWRALKLRFFLKWDGEEVREAMTRAYEVVGRLPLSYIRVSQLKLD